MIRVPLDHALELVWRGELRDAKSALALIHAARHVGGCDERAREARRRARLAQPRVGRARSALVRARRSARLRHRLHRRRRLAARARAARPTCSTAGPRPPRSIARTQRIRIASIRLVQHWNAAHLAQVAATAERIAPGRLHFFASIGDRPEDRALGPAAARPRASASRGSTRRSTRCARSGAASRSRATAAIVTLEGARVRPTPPGGRAADRGGRQGRATARGGRAPCGRLERELAGDPGARRGRGGRARPRRAARRADRPGGDPAPALDLHARRAALAAATRSRSSGAGTRGSATSRTPSSRPRSWSGSRPSAASGSPRWPRELDLEMPVLDLSGLDCRSASGEALEALPAGDIR